MPHRLIRRQHPEFFVLIAGLAAAVVFLVACKGIEASPPSEAELPGILAKDERVGPDEVHILGYEVARGEPAVLYRLTDQPFHFADGSAMPQPLKLSPLVHPFGHPWEWTEGGGSYGWLPVGDAAVSLDLVSASGDTGTVINTTIFGAALPEAAEIQLTVRGQRYIRDLRQSDGYIILLPDQGVSPVEITDIRVLDASGHELPLPSGFGAGIGTPASHP